MVISGEEKVLIAGGMLNLAYGTLLGYPITVIRVKGARHPEVPDGDARQRAAARRDPARPYVGRPAVHVGRGWPDLAAWLVVVSSALIAAKDTVNWLTGVKDEFSEKPKTAAPLAALAASGTTVGIGIFVVGVLKAL